MVVSCEQSAILAEFYVISTTSIEMCATVQVTLLHNFIMIGTVHAQSLGYIPCTVGDGSPEIIS